ncbi:MAG: porin [Gammaproteobacteria bacterium]|nr:porin [Gammaproteobacteria bacterium]MDH5652028.1 porin [Gammaproteobacteria bacterium]
MRKQMIATGLLAGMLTPLMSMAADPEVYGRLHLSYGQVQEEVAGTKITNNWQMRSHSSRLGVKGSRSFNKDLSGIYNIEFGVNPDSDDYGTGDNTAGLSRRDQYVGLKGGFGELRLGRQETPLKLIQEDFDQFNDTDGDFARAGDQTGEDRMDSMVTYLGGSGKIDYSIAFAPGEDPGTGGNADTGPADNIMFSLKYKAGPLYLGIAQSMYENGAGAESDSQMRLVAIYQMKEMQVGFLYQNGVATATNANNEETWMGFSMGMKTGSTGKFKVQYVMVEDNAPTVTENTLLAIGYEHKYDKQTTGYAMYSSRDSDTGGTSSTNTFLGVGMEFRF